MAKIPGPKKEKRGTRQTRRKTISKRKFSFTGTLTGNFLYEETAEHVYTQTPRTKTFKEENAPNPPESEKQKKNQNSENRPTGIDPEG